MSNGGGGYLVKLRALRSLKRPVSAHEIARYLDVAYETARSGMRRMEKSGHVLGVRSDARFRGEVLFSLTALGVQALADGVELTFPSDRKSRIAPREPTGATVQIYEWRDLHDALDMGVPIVAEDARRVTFHLDRDRMAA